jgi:glycogen debranching enzyme
LFSFYFQKTKDKKFLDSHWENILRAIHWIEEYGDKDKDLFIEYQRKNQKGLFHQGWKDSFEDHLRIEPPIALVEVQGYQYLALREIASLAAKKGDQKLVKKLEKRAFGLKEKFNVKFWMAPKKFFALALDGKKQQREAITSNPGHLLFTGIIKEKEKREFVVKRLFEKDMFTPYGIRTHSELEEDFDPKSYHLGSVWPHDNWIIAQGLKKLGYQKEYQKIKKAILRAYKELGYLPEYYGVINGKITLDLSKPPCYLQAWSLGALFNFL